MKIKKFSFRNVSDKLSESELKRLYGGYDYGGCFKLQCTRFEMEMLMTITGTNDCFGVAERECDKNSGFVCKPC